MVGGVGREGALHPQPAPLLPGGMMSIFLMGCYDPSSQKWCTVTKCSGGHDDATLARLQKELDMVKISKVGRFAGPGLWAGHISGTAGSVCLCSWEQC